MQTENYENLQLKAIEVQIQELKFLVGRLHSEKVYELEKSLPKWVNLELACKTKGGCAFSTVKTRWWLQPCCGTESERIGGRKCWHKEDVIDWLDVTDSQLPEYAKKYGVKIPA